MQENQKSVGSNGLQNVLVPTPYLVITQWAEGGKAVGYWTHDGTYAVDIATGYGQTNTAYYAPCDVVKQWVGNDSTVKWYSPNRVNFVNGQSGYLGMFTVHDNNAWGNVGKTYVQGEIIGHQGTAGNVTGMHVHLECGIYPTLQSAMNATHIQNSYGNWMLNGSGILRELMGVNNTPQVFLNGYQPWTAFVDRPSPPNIVSAQQRDIGNYTREIQGHATSSATIVRGSLKIEFVPNNETNRIVLYEWNGGVNVSDWFTAWDKVVIRKSGQLYYTLSATDNYDQTASKEFYWNIIVIFDGDDIIPLYMMNIIDGGYTPYQ